MTDANKRANVASELARADESMRAARVLVDAALLHDAESRLYYASYHAAVALLLTEGLEPRSHAGTASMLGLHFVKTGRMDPEDARLFARIQKYRLEADYGRDFVLTEAPLREDLASCQTFLDRARGTIGGFLRGA
ncbi:MAG: DNA-binding protein [Acidobacteria bacterium]|nr:MAG: DNA-binding protein [Acidobacteriota bacterium]